MYTYLAKISLRDTDATGVLYFTEQMRLCVEALESFLEEKGFPLARMIETLEYVIPIVHVESDYFSSLKVGDPLEIQLSLGSTGASSFTLKYTLYSRGTEKGKVSIVHVVVDKETRTSLPLPADLTKLLDTLNL